MPVVTSDQPAIFPEVNSMIKSYIEFMSGPLF